MNRLQLAPFANEKLIAIALLIASFLPIEPSCAPGNIVLILSPFIYLGARYFVFRKLKRIDLIIVAGFVVLILFTVALASSTGCTKDYNFIDIVQPEWQRVNIDSLGADGKIYVKNIKSLQIATTDLIIHVNGTQLPCPWESNTRYLAPGETKYCQLPLTCGNRTMLIEVFAPGNNDSVLC